MKPTKINQSTIATIVLSRTCDGRIYFIIHEKNLKVLIFTFYKGLNLFIKKSV